MGRVNLIQSKITELEGGAFQSLFDEYLYKKYGFNNIQTLGVQTGTNKPTKGIPDSYVLTDEGKYILICYGTVESQPAKKIENDILSCFDTAKLSLNKDKIKKIICGYRSTNIHIEQFQMLKEAIDGVEIELIGIDTLSYDLALKYPHIAKDHLGIAIDTNQIFDIEEFVNVYDANGINAPIDCGFLHRENDLDAVCKSIHDNTVTILTGPSGIGKTRLAVEVCRRLETEYSKIYCVRSNGNLLYEDIKYYFDNPGKYLVFFDDANMVVSLDNILNTLLTLPKGYDIQVLITVRNYAKDRILHSAMKYPSSKKIELGRLKDEEIKDILRKNLDIQNPEFLRKISEIANGNPRLAILAGLRSVDKGYWALHSVEDIFRNYYGHIINDARLNKADILMLFLIAIAGPVKKDKNKLYSELKERYCAEINELEIIEKLYTAELIDWFKNEVLNIADQSFGNYILYYVLIEKRWISIEDFIKMAFPQYRNKVIYALNTLTEIFYSKEIDAYVKSSIISAWDKASVEQEMSYLESFYPVGLNKSMGIIKKHIDQEKSVDFDLQNFDIDAKKNHRIIQTKEIQILGGYKYTKLFEDSIDLILLYFKKRPDLFMEFYFVITDYLLYDKDSAINHYKNEMVLLDKLWQSTNDGENINNSLLYIHIAKDALQTEFTRTEEGRNLKAINFIRMTVKYTEEIGLLRSKIWNTLGILRKKDVYCDVVNEILSEVHFNGLDKENSQKYLYSDFATLYSDVLNTNEISFQDARIINEYREVAGQIGCPVDERYLIAEKNQDFRVFMLLSGKPRTRKPYEDDEKNQRDRISSEIRNYHIEDFRTLFLTCDFLEKTIYAQESYALNRGLEIVFELLEEDSDLYIQVITEYFNSNAPFRISGDRQVKYLLNVLGYEKTYSLLSQGKYQRKELWLSLIWEYLDESDITETAVNDYRNFAVNNLKSSNVIVPSPQTLKKYGERDDDLRNVFIKAIAEQPVLSFVFLNYAYNDENTSIILLCFKDDFEALSRTYLNARTKKEYFDYNGKLFERIFEKRNEIWAEYVMWIKNNSQRDDYEYMIVDSIWNTEKWESCIDFAFDVLINQNGMFLLEQFAQLLFGKSESESEIVCSRKKQWLLSRLHENILDNSKCRLIIDIVVSVRTAWKLEFILEYLHENKRIDDFKQIHLLPMSASWSGSEVPLIIDQIKFLESIKEQLKGIDYIDHRDYIETRQNALEKYKEEVELNEYIENAIYA